MSAKLALGCAVLMSGCVTGASTHLRFDGVSYPLSMSPCVADADGTLLGLGDLEVVGQLTLSTTAHGILWNQVSLGDIDLSEAVNTRVAQAGGEAVVAMSFRAENTVWNGAWPFHWLPFWIGAVDATVEGTIVKRRAGGPEPPQGCALEEIE